MSEATWLSEIEISGDGIAVSLPNQHNNVPLAAPVPGQVTVTAMCFDVGGLHRSARWGIASGRAAPRPIGRDEALANSTAIRVGRGAADHHPG
jgi:hypothetical protein